MNIDLKDSNIQELQAYQIALLQVQINCNEQLARIKAKIVEVKTKRRNNESSNK
jgi:hypothetical protein